MPQPNRPARLARWTLDHPRAALTLAALLTLLAALFALPPKVNGDLLAMVPADDVYAKALRELRESPEGKGWLVLTFPETADLDEAAARVEALDTVAGTFHELSPELERRLALARLPPEELERLGKRLKGAMRTSNPFIQGQLLAGLELPVVEAEPWLSPGSLVVFPNTSSLDPVACVALVEALEAVAPDALWIAGPQVATARSLQGVQRDLLRTTGLSVALVLLVLTLGLRDWRHPLLLLPPALLGGLVAVAVAQLMGGSLNLYSSLGAALLFGLGVDFGVHLTARFGEERAKGAFAEEAITRAFEGSGPACVTAGLTSAAAFLVLGGSDFPGLQQLGLMLAVGLMACLGFTFLLLPLLLRRYDPKARPPLALRAWQPKRPGVALALLLALTLAASAWGLPKLELEHDLSALRRSGEGWDDLSAQEQAWRAQAQPPVVLQVAPERLVEEQARLQAMVEAGELPRVSAVLSTAALMPPGGDAALAAAQGLVSLADDPNIDRLPGSLREALAPLAGLDTSPLRVEDLPQGLRRMLGDGALLLLVVDGNLMDLRASEELRLGLEAAGVTGGANEFLAHGSMSELLERELPRLAWLTLLGVALLAALDLRKPALVLVAVGSLVGALAWAGVVIAALGVRLNMVNLVALPILLGIGVDVIVHLLHRLESDRDVQAALGSAGQAAAISTATTLAAFSSLTLAETRGVQSLGLLVAFGLSAVFLGAVVATPLGWMALRDPRPSDPAPPPG